ncbi:MAG: carbamoyltransferase HypF [Saprospiraceae bacterium]|nr:carbamoyltransferase HypF [Saprospiraceae bacterium]
METWHIHIKGQVQGVGFRPFVYRLAIDNRLNGWVCNTTDGVHIEINATKNQALFFHDLLLKKSPKLAVISGHSIEPINHQYYSDFRIIHSKNKGEANLLLTPDFSMCEDCREELNAENNRRKNYPFITCTNCGPRFSITHQLPYDRETTTMSIFELCPTCQKEYNDPIDRRYYSQTNSCPVCNIQLSLYDANQNLLTQKNKECMDMVVNKWRSGKIVAIKGIGGYLLTCDAGNVLTVNKLRRRKHRPTKPFAVMYPSLEYLSEQIEIPKEELKALTSIESPIVILDNLPSSKTETLAPGLECLGVMLPYTPLYDLLLKEFGKPIVATSGNRSNSPIVFQDEKALSDLTKIADYILVNNREIVVPQDDSVVKFSPKHRQKIILRRSRGMAPSYVQPALKLTTEKILSTGAMLKSTFTFLHRGNTFISQYLGDLESFDTQENYRHTVNHFFRLFDDHPEVILADKHPQYFSTIYGQQLAQSLDVSIEKIQHHVAHFGAALGEHNLLNSKELILGVIWDGTGLGDDGHIWGGEFFKYENYEFTRSFHFDYFDFILADKMPKEPRISALCATWDIEEARAYLRPKFTPVEWQVYLKKLERGSSLKTSSVGRLFDAVASLLGIMDKSNYEGEAAMLLEKVASDYFKNTNLDDSEAYFLEKEPNVKALMSGIIDDLNKGKSKGFIAAKFHFSLVMLVKQIASHLQVKKLVFSGGVFQNSLLVDLMNEYLSKDFQLYFHHKLSPNDENISFGQLICYRINQLKKQKVRLFSVVE